MERKEKWDRIVDLRKQADELALQLEASMLIEDIWPDAFTAGNGVSFGGKIQNGKFTRAYFQRSDGFKRILSQDELLRLKPDAKIHKDYRG